MPHQRRRLVPLMFLTSALGYMDRSAIGIVAPLIAADLHLKPSEMGLVFSAFFVGYALFALIGGWAADCFGAKRVIVLSLLVWSAFCGATALAGSLVFLLVVRVLFGVGEGPFPPAQNKLIGQWFPRREQATTQGLCGSGEPLGGALAGPIVGALAVTYSWRLSFGVIATIGVFVTLIWALWVKDWPEHDKRISPEEQATIVRDRVSEYAVVESSAGLLTVCMNAGVLATALALFGYAYVLFFFLSWFPTYLVNQHHLSIQHSGFVSALPWLCGFAGRLSGGFLSDAIFRKTGSALFARKVVVGGGLAVSAACIALAGYVQSTQGAVLLTSVSVFALSLTTSGYWALILDLVPHDKVGGAGGFCLGVGSTAGILAPAITGMIVSTYQSFVGAFAITGTVAAAGAVALLFLVRHRDAQMATA